MNPGTLPPVERLTDWRPRVANVAASCGVVMLACAAHLAAPYNRADLARLYDIVVFSFTGKQFLIAAASLYMAGVACYFILSDDGSPSKSLRFFQVVARLLRAPAATLRQPLETAERVAVLATLLKAFFAPMMTIALMTFCVAAMNSGSALTNSVAAGIGGRELFDRFGFWLALQLIFFVDVWVFTIGYLIESPRLHNEIRSVDPTVLGWGAALLCYPPFNQLTVALLGSQHTDFPQFADPTLHVTLNVLMLVLLAGYAASSLALGLKASNLTHRGIVARGPYALVRHPAYTCKNIAWWIGATPLVWVAFERSPWEGLQAIGTVAGWTLLYALRALTEEDHLRSVDGSYAVYAQQVRYRFIPGLY